MGELRQRVIGGARAIDGSSAMLDGFAKRVPRRAARKRLDRGAKLAETCEGPARFRGSTGQSVCAVRPRPRRGGGTIVIDKGACPEHAEFMKTIFNSSQLSRLGPWEMRSRRRAWSRPGARA